MCELQLCTISMFPSHSFPPLKATTLTVLVDVLVPPAQVLEQLDQGYQGDQEQSTETIIHQQQLI